MGYKYILFENTGLNSVNLPYDKEALLTFASNMLVRNVELEIRQQRFLDKVRVKEKWTDVNQCDYIALVKTNETTAAGIKEDFKTDNGWCYFVTNVTMVADDTAELSLLPDYITSVNGCTALGSSGTTNATIKFLDGIVNRSTWAVKNLNPVDVDLDDSMLTPSGSMELTTDKYTPAQSGRTIILSTINIGKAASIHKSVTFDTGGTGATASGAVNVPTLQYVDDDESLSFVLHSRTLPYSGVYGNIFSNVTSGSGLQTGLGVIRALGLEASIIDQYYLPGEFADVDIVSDSYYGHIDTITGKSGSITFSTNNTNASHGNGLVSKFLNYSSYEKCGIITPAGNKLEANPQDLFTKNDNTYTIADSIDVSFVADPRPDGCPYYCLTKLHGVSDDIYSKLFRSIPGLRWQKIPLIFNTPSGSSISKMKYNASREVYEKGTDLTMQNINEMYNLNRKSGVERSLDLGNDAYSDFLFNPNPSFKDFVTGIGGAVAKDVNKVVSDVMSSTVVQTVLSRDILKKQNEISQRELQFDYYKDYLQDRLEYDISMKYYVPDVMFPYDAIIYNFFGNGLVRYKYKYRDDDLNRLRTIIKAYGIKYSEMLESKYFGSAALMDAGDTNSTKYLYIQTNSCSVSGRAKWINEGIAMQLNGGVRFWKGRPVHIRVNQGE